MSDYSSLKATINANVKANDNHEITGTIMNSVLNAMVASLGAGYQYMGLATPTSPGTPQSPDYNCFYLATTPGTYSNLGGKLVNDNEVCFLAFNGTWRKDVLGVATANEISLVNEILRDGFSPIKGVSVSGTITTGEFWKDSGGKQQLASTKWVLFPVDVTKKYVLNGLTLPSSNWVLLSFVYLDANQNHLANSNDEHHGPYNFENVVVDNFPAGCAYIGANGRLPDTITLNELDGWSLKDENYLKMRGSLPSCDLNSVTENGVWLLDSANTYQNVPNNASVGFLRVSMAGAPIWGIQEFIDFSGGGYYKRIFNARDSVFEAWQIVNKAQVDNLRTEMLGEIDALNSYLFEQIGKNLVALAPKTLLSPTQTISGYFVRDNGTIGELSGMSYRIYPVEQGKYYCFSGRFTPGINTNFIVWFDANGQFVKADSRHGSTSEVVDMTNEPLQVPNGAAFAYMNVQNSQAAFSNFNELSDLRISVVSDVMRTKGALPSCDLNDVRENGFWILVDSNTYQNVPNNASVGFLRVTIAEAGNWGVQEFFNFSGGNYYKRRFQAAQGSFEAWQSVGGGGGTIINNNYEFNSYPQTLNVTASPVITADTNQYLASTGDTTDRTADILTLLNQTGVCRLGTGVFYVQNLVMPNGTSIIGSGNATRVILASSVTDGFAIRMGSECLLSKFKLEGQQSAPHSVVGTRHGILWQGDYTQSQTAPSASLISDLVIDGFNGGGITCYDTGYGTFNFIDASNILITKCDAGINISYWSEFHKFTNVRTMNCYFGCVNNGGNNVFVNCDFSSCQGKAFVMDNSQGQSPNNSHGSCVGCVFNHTASNTGIGVEILNCHSGFTFVGCQIFFSQLHLVDSDGVIFDGCNGGKNNCDITISGGGAVVFANNMWEGAIPITITNNQNVHFVNCYNKATGAVIQP